MTCRRDGRTRRLGLEKLEARECFAIGEALPAVWEQQLREVLQHGGELDLPAGKISISQPLHASPEAGPITIRGAGIAKTVIEVDYDARVPLLSIKNTTTPIQLSGLTFDGNDHRSIGLRLVAVTNFTMTRVELGHFQESAFIGQQLRGARFDDCYFIHSGDAASDSPAVVLDKIDADQPATDSSGNTFVACRWENNRYVGLRLNRANTTDIVASKFHGTWPQSVPYDHLQLNRTTKTSIIANNFVHAGGDAIQIWESALADVCLNQISQNDGFGVRFIKSPNNYVANNEFGTFVPLENGRGDVWTELPLSGRPTSTTAAAINTALAATNPVVQAAAKSVSEVVTTLRPGDNLAAALKWGGAFQLEPGVYDITEPILAEPGAKLSLRGAGSTETILRVTGDFLGPALLVTGTDGMPNKGLEVSGLSIDGRGRDAACLRLDRVMHANFTDVEIRDFDGKAVDGTQFWDSVFRDCRFVRCGSEARSVGAVALRAGDADDPYTSSNNVMFLGCDFMDNAYTSVEMESLTAKVRILGCHFSHPSAPPASHGGIHLGRRSSMNVVAANTFQEVDPQQQLQDYGSGNIVGASFINLTPPPVDNPPVNNPLPVDHGEQDISVDGSFISVKDFGAVGDGISDDTAAIQAAIAYAGADGGVYYPKGTYLVTQASENQRVFNLTASGQSHVGEPGTVIKLAYGTAQGTAAFWMNAADQKIAGLTFDLNGVTNAKGIGVRTASVRGKIHGCTFNGSAATGGVGVSISGDATDLSISGNHFYGCAYGVLSTQGSSPTHILISNNVLDGNGRPTGNAISIDSLSGDAADISVTGNMIRNWRSTQVVIGFAHVTRGVISGNNIDDCDGPGIHLEDGTTDVTVSDNKVSRVGGTGLEVLSGARVSRRIALNGNTLVDCLRLAPVVGAINISGTTRCEEIIVANNTVSNCGSAASACSSMVLFANNSRVTGNVISNTQGTTTGGIKLNAGSNNLVSGNRCFDDKQTKTQDYGLIVAGNQSSVQILDNDFTGNGTGTIDESGIGTKTLYSNRSNLTASDAVVDAPPVDPPRAGHDPNRPLPSRPLPDVDRDWRLARGTEEPPTMPPITAPPIKPRRVHEPEIIPRRGRFLARG